MLLPLVFLLVGFALGLVATGAAGGLIRVEATWLVVVLSGASAYLIIFAGRGLWRHWQGEGVKADPGAGRRLFAHGVAISSIGTGLLLLAVFGDQLDGAIHMVAPGSLVVGGAGVLLEMLGLGCIAGGRQLRASGAPVGHGDKAAKTLPGTPGAGPARFIAVLPGVGMAVILLGMVAGPMGSCISSCMGYDEVVLQRLNACVDATTLLGEPIQQARFGWSCGNAETEGSFGQASWTMPVQGPLGRGSVSFAVEKRGGPWELLGGELEVGEQTVDIVNCRSAMTVNLTTVDRYQGTVVSVVGAVPLAAGAPCLVVVGPGGKDGVCRAQISCADLILYGAGSTGYLTCGVEQRAEGQPLLSLQDGSPTADGGDPLLDLRMSTGQVIVSDHGPSGLWAVHIQLVSPN